MIPTRWRLCAEAGCGTLVQGGRCPAHRRQSWARTDEGGRIRGRRLQQLRRDLLASSPLCVRCRSVGLVTPATIRDHIVALALGGTEDPSNVQTLCSDCNEAKRRDEARAGAKRSREAKVKA